MSHSISPEEWFHVHAGYYVNTLVVFHLNQCGVFAALSRDSEQDSDTLAKSLGLDQRVLEYLLCYLASTDQILNRLPDGKYKITDFGHAVLKRYSRSGSDGSYNLFDVRVGGYGEIWNSLSQILKGDLHIGKNIHRDGKFSESALFHLSKNLQTTADACVRDLNPTSVVEFGIGSGLVHRLASGKNQSSKQQFFGIDTNKRLIKEIQTKTNDTNSVKYIAEDLFDVDSWSTHLNPTDRIWVFSLHFHEFMIHGPEKMIAMLRRLCQQFKNLHVGLFEEVKPGENEPASEGKNFYSHTNLLIHDLCEKGRIQSFEGWKQLMEAGGLVFEKEYDTKFLQFKLYLFRTLKK